MDTGEPGQRSHFLVDAGIVLHGAGTQGIKTGVDAMDLFVQLRVVTAQIRLADLGQSRPFLPDQCSRKDCFFHIAARQVLHTTTGHAFFKN